MSDQICVNVRKLYHIILCDGGDMEDAEIASKTIKQPAQGYYPVTEIYKFIEKRRAEKCK